MNSHTKQFEEYTRLIEENLYRFLPDTDCLQSSVIEAMKYSLSAGGKRIRPTLLLEFCRASGGNPMHAIPFACAIEMIHTYSLIHDDLPCMDDDDLRRGRPSCHIAFGESTALLAGDALLNLAFETMLDKKNHSGLDSDTVVKVAGMLARNSGVMGMIGGQVIDLENEGKAVSEDVLRELHKNKTGALIRAAAQMGVILGGGSQEMLSAADAYAENIGLAFQVVDDILDYLGDEKLLGKPIGSDRDNQKTTFVSLYGTQKSKEIAANLTNRAKQAVGTAFKDCEFLLWLADYLCVRNK